MTSKHFGKGRLSQKKINVTNTEINVSKFVGRTEQSGFRRFPCKIKLIFEQKNIISVFTVKSVNPVWTLYTDN